MSSGGKTLHAYDSVFLLSGDECSMLVEAGHPQDLDVIEQQLDFVLSQGVPEVKYIFVTHAETPHAGGTGRWLDRFPGAVACGDVSDMHLVWPALSDRMRPLTPGDSVDLGGTTFRVVEAVFRDHVSSRWGFDTRRKVLFAGDGFAYSHYHEEGQCGCLAEEVPSLNLSEMLAVFAELAFIWTRYVDIEPYVKRLDNLMCELDVQMIAPTHGLPIADPGRTMPLVRAGLRGGERQTDTAR